MNQQHLAEFKQKTHDLLSLLAVLLQFSEDIESQERLYEENMKSIQIQNKTLGEREKNLITRERDIKDRETGSAIREQDNAKVKENLLRREQSLLKDREQLALSRVELDKERTKFEAEKVTNQQVQDLKTTYEKKIKEALETNRHLTLREEQVSQTRVEQEAQGKWITKETQRLQKIAEKYDTFK